MNYSTSKPITIREINNTIKDHKIKFIDLKFSDLFGSMQHITFPIEVFDEKIFIDGVPIDGSSIRGFQRIHESDMLIKPDASSMFIDPFMDDPSLSFMCNVKEPVSQKIYTRDTRAVAQKAERYLESTRIADTAYLGPELEFFIFDHISFDQSVNEGFYHLDSVEEFSEPLRVQWMLRMEK